MEFGDGGIDRINTGSTPDPSIDGNDIVLGGHLGDFIDVGEGDNIVLGDDGAIDYVVGDTGSTSRGADVEASDIDLIVSLSTAFAGGVDDIDTGSGDDIIIGGRLGDDIDVVGGNNIVIGDSGQITAADANSPVRGSQPLTEMVIGSIATTQQADGGADDITTGADRDIILAGVSGTVLSGDNTLPDVIRSGDGADIVIGDNGRVVYDLDATVPTSGPG